jgi:hypothetical protein
VEWTSYCPRLALFVQASGDVDDIFPWSSLDNGAKIQALVVVLLDVD